MARTPIKPNAAADAIEEIAQGERIDQMEDALTEINRAAGTDDISSNWEVDAYRIQGPAMRGLRQPWLFRCALDALPDLHQRLHDEYGTGVYRIRVRNNKKIFRAFDIEVEKSAAPPPAAPKQESSELVTLLRENFERQERLIAALAQRLDQAPQAVVAQPNIFEGMKQMAEAMTAWQATTPKPESNALEMFKMGLELAGKIGAGAVAGGGESNLVDLARDVLTNESFGGAMKAFIERIPVPQQQQPNMRGGRRPMGQPQRNAIERPAEEAAPAAPINPNAQVPPGLDAIMQKLIRAAKEGKQPEFFAEETLDNLTDDALELLDQAPDPVVFLGQFYPDVLIYRPWFERLDQAMQRASADVENDGAATVAHAAPLRAAGDAGDVETNGEARTPEQS